MIAKTDLSDYGLNTTDGLGKIIIERLDSKKVTNALRQDINNLLKQLSPNCPQYDSNRALSSILDNQNLLVLIVFNRENKKVIGIASALFRFMLSDISIGIGDVVVDEKYRGRKIGKTLLKTLIDQIKIYNGSATHISLTSHPSREAANKLYQKLGFKKRETNVYRLQL